MSKLTKLLNDPTLFAKDFVKKRMGGIFQTPDEIKVKPPAAKKTAKKVVSPKTAAVKKVSPVLPVVTILLNYIKNVSECPVVFHCGESINVGYPMCQHWLYLTKDFNKSSIFLIRNIDLYKKLLANFPNRNFAYAKSPVDVEEFLKKYTVEKICFISNTANNIHLIRFNEYRHIFVGNFDELRQPSSHKYFRVYDECWIYSQSKLEEMHENIQLRHLHLRLLDNPFGFFEKNTANYVTYVLQNTVDVYFSSHFMLGDIANLRESQNKFFNVYLSSTDISNGAKKYLNSLSIKSSADPNLIDVMDVVILDYSAEKILKFLRKNIPILVYQPSFDHEKTEKIEISEELIGLCYTFENVEDIENILSQLEQGNDFLKLNREEFVYKNFGMSLSSSVNFRNYLNEFFVGV